MAAASAGDTVVVLGGEYREQIQLKSGVTVRAQIPREAVLRAVPPSAAGSEAPAILADRVRNARVSGMRIAGAPDAPLSIGILLADSAVTLEDDEVDGAKIGIEIRAGANPTAAANPSLVGNAVHDCIAEGLLITGTTTPWISHNTFQRNKGGVRARDGAQPAFVGNVFEKTALQLLPTTDMKGIRERNFLLDERRAGR
jgi:hypothetical protein